MILWKNVPGPRDKETSIGTKIGTTKLRADARDKYGNIDSKFVAASEDYIPLDESPTATKELLFEDDGATVIFHFNEFNQWSIEIIQKNEKNIPASLKKKDISIPSFDFRSTLPGKVEMQQSKEYLKMTMSKSKTWLHSGFGRNQLLLH